MTPEQRSLQEHQQARISAILAKAAAPEWSRKKLIFLIRDDEETERRLKLPALTPPLTPRLSSHPLVSSIRYDAEGEIYGTDWREIKEMRPGLKVLWQLTDIRRQPPKELPKTKTAYLLTFNHIKNGLDVALRRWMRIRDKYLLEQGEYSNQEGLQMAGGLERVAELRENAMRIGELTEADLEALAEETLTLLGRLHLVSPRLADKRRARELFLKGLTDRRGRKNYLGAMTRLFAVELILRKRMEIKFPQVLGKYVTETEMLRFERDLTRRVMRESSGRLARLADRPIFKAEFSGWSVERRRQEAERIYGELSSVSRSLTQTVRAKPYLSVCREAVAVLGTKILPEGTKARKEQEEREERGVPTVHDLLLWGSFSEAGKLIQEEANSLQKNLDFYRDFRTVLLSKMS